MLRKKPSSKRRRSKEALGIAGVSLSLGAASASTPPQSNVSSHLLYDEEITDATSATFHALDEKWRSVTEKSAFKVARSAGGTGTGASAVKGSSCRRCYWQACRACRNAY